MIKSVGYSYLEIPSQSGCLHPEMRKVYKGTFLLRLAISD